MLPATMPTESYVTVTAAAAQTGIPARTIRRWLERSQLAGQMTEDRGRLVDPSSVRALAVETGHPAAVAWVLSGTGGHAAEGSATVPANLPGGGHAAGQAAEEGAGVVELARLVRDQQQQLLELAGRVGWLQSENHRLTEQVRLLAPPANEPAPSESANEPMPNHTTPAGSSPLRASEQPIRGPWWRHWWPWTGQPV
jgi:hypothetical protein